MKKIYFICIIFLVILGLTVTSVYSAENPIVFEGSEQVVKDSTNKVLVKLNTNKLIGGIEGTIETSSNLTIVTVNAKNSWNLTYNSENGKFNMVKNSGAQSEDILEIEYKVANIEGEGLIEINNIFMSDISDDYNEIEVPRALKEITIVKQQSPSDDSTNTNTEDNNSTNTNTQNNNSTNSKTDNKSTNTKSINSTDTTSISKNALPKTGAMSVIIPIVVLILIIISAGAYMGYRKYKGIK